MTQKTNQFNLTTKRYTESEISNFINSESSIVYSISVSDKYGDSGITGLSILTLDRDNSSAHIDSLLMSCRIIGRNIEFIFFETILEDIKRMNISSVYGTYKKTNKNEQVSNLYDSFGCIVDDSGKDFKHYKLSLKEYSKSNIDYIEVNHVN